MSSRELLLSLGNENSSAIFSDAMRQAFLDGAAAIGTLEAIKSALAPVLCSEPAQGAPAADVSTVPVAECAPAAHPAAVPATGTLAPAKPSTAAAPTAESAADQSRRKEQGGRRAPWTAQEDDRLVAEWRDSNSDEPLFTALSRWAQAHGRTPYALALRLAQTHQLISAAQAEEIRQLQYGNDPSPRGQRSRQAESAQSAPTPPAQAEAPTPAPAEPPTASGPSFTEDLLDEPMGDPGYLTDEEGSFDATNAPDSAPSSTPDGTPDVAAATAPMDLASAQASAPADRFVHEPSAKLVGLCNKLRLEMELSDDVSSERGRVLLDYISHEPLKAFALLTFCRDPNNAGKLSARVRDAAIACLSCLCDELTARGFAPVKAGPAPGAARTS